MKKKLPGNFPQANDGLLLEGFRAYEIGTGQKNIPDYVRRDFYKVCVTDGDFLFTYDDRVTVSSGAILFFGSPKIPYTCQALAPAFSGFACVFTAAFLKRHDPSLDPGKCALFSKGAPAVIDLSIDQDRLVRDIFKKMIAEAKGNRKRKDDIVRGHIISILRLVSIQE